MKEWNEVESLFVREIVSEHGTYIVDLLADTIEELNQKRGNRNALINTGELIDSLNWDVKKISNGYVLEISFLGYGRAVEIQYFKSKQLRRDTSAKTEAKNLRRASKKDTRFYSKNVYGSINRLLGRVSSEYSDEEIKRLKGILNTKIIAKGYEH